MLKPNSLYLNSPLPDVVQDGKFKGEMKRDNGNRPKVGLKNVKNSSNGKKGKRDGSSPSKSSCQPQSKRRTKNVFSDYEPVLGPHYRISNSTPGYKNRQDINRQDINRLKKKFLSAYDPLLGATMMKPSSKVEYPLKPLKRTFKRVPNLKKEMLNKLESVPGLELTSFDTEQEQQKDSASFHIKQEGQDDTASFDTKPEEQQNTASLDIKQEQQQDTARFDSELEQEDITRLDTESEQKYSTNFDIEPEQKNYSVSFNTASDQKHSVFPENTDMMIFTPKSDINKKIEMLIFTPKSDFNKKIEMLISRYELHNKKYGGEKTTESKERLLMEQELLALKNRIAVQEKDIFNLQKKEIFNLQKKESRLQEKLRYQYEIEQILSDELQNFNQQFSAQRLEVFQKQEILEELSEERRKQEVYHLLSLIRLKEENAELRSKLDDRENEFYAIMNAYQADISIISECNEREKILNETIAVRKDSIQKSNKRLENLEAYVNPKMKSARDQIDAEKKCFEKENIMLNAFVKKAHSDISSLESTLRMKTDEYSNLTQVFHDLTNTKRESL